MARIFIVTGASGAGKTTLVRSLEARRLPGVSCHYFDSVGVPPVEAMIAEFGSPEGWQAATTQRWIATLAAEADPDRLAVLDGQVRPSEVLAAFDRCGVTRGGILLVDCSREVRESRLREERGQPGLATPEMTAWAAYLRGQADALGLPILDTTRLTVSAATDALASHVRDWAAS